ncbi:hypothetical protein [Lysobacter gummosus]|uniref:hypothetical protein n=1 Tax=Lysobacter gummosus TaxID=262324 RepID=UPI00362F84F0
MGTRKHANEIGGARRMIYDKKVIVHSLSGVLDDMQALVEQWLALEVNYVSFVGLNASRLQDEFLDVCVMLSIRDGRETTGEPDRYFILSSAFDDERMDEAMELAFVLGGHPVRPVCVLKI